MSLDTGVKLNWDQHWKFSHIISNEFNRTKNMLSGEEWETIKGVCVCVCMRESQSLSRTPVQMCRLCVLWVCPSVHTQYLLSLWIMRIRSITWLGNMCVKKKYCCMLGPTPAIQAKKLCFQVIIWNRFLQLFRILWQLFVFQVTLSTVEKLERMVSSHLRRQLGLLRILATTNCKWPSDQWKWNSRWRGEYCCTDY